MARSSYQATYTCSFEQAKRTVEEILARRNYKPYALKTGENVFKCGVGMMTAMKYIKPEYADGSVTLYGWVQAGLGSVGGSEMGLEGFVAIVPKKQVKSCIDEIIKALK